MTEALIEATATVELATRASVDTDWIAVDVWKGLTMNDTKKIETSARVVEVIEVRTMRGSGTDTDPDRMVHLYFDKEGSPLATRDVWAVERTARVLRTERDELLRRLGGLDELSAAHEVLKRQCADEFSRGVAIGRQNAAAEAQGKIDHLRRLLAGKIERVTEADRDDLSARERAASEPKPETPSRRAKRARPEKRPARRTKR